MALYVDYIIRPNASKETLKCEISSIKYRMRENSRVIKRMRFETERTIKKLENRNAKFAERLAEMEKRYELKQKEK